MLLPREAQEGKDEGDEAAVDEPSQDLLLLRRVGRVPCIRLAAKATDQDPLLVAEAVEAELAVVAPHPAVAHAAEGHVRVGELGCIAGPDGSKVRSSLQIICFAFPARCSFSFRRVYGEAELTCSTVSFTSIPPAGTFATNSSCSFLFLVKR